MHWHLLAVFLVTFLASTMSGLAGGGGSFIITPFYIFLGLTPQQAVATGKFGGFGLSVGAVSAFKGRMLENRRLSVLVVAVTTVVGVISSFVLQKINNSHLQLLIGLVMLAMVPFVFFKHRNLHKTVPSSRLKTIGMALLAVVLFVQGILSSGIGSLTSVIFILFFGMTPLQANVMKRKTSLILTIIMPLVLLNSGLINVRYGLCGMVGGFLGGFIGSRAAVKRGDNFARYALLAFTVLSGIWLIATA